MVAASPRTRFASPLLFLISFAVLSLPDTAVADGGPFLVHLERGDSMQALRVEPATFGMFRYVRTDSVEGYLSWHRVKSIRDASGREVARDVLERRRAIGVDPLLYRIGDGGLRRRHAPRREDRTFGIFEMGTYRQVSGPTSYGDDDVMMPRRSARCGIYRGRSPWEESCTSRSTTTGSAWELGYAVDVG